MPGYKITSACIICPNKGCGTPLILANFISGRVWVLDYVGNNKLLLETGLNISSFGVDENNELNFHDSSNVKFY